jgi:hypothetical protein
LLIGIISSGIPRGVCGLWGSTHPPPPKFLSFDKG